MTDGRLFEFDEIDAALDLVPLAARRILDHLGAKLSLEGWRSLQLADRQTLLKLGSRETIEEEPALEVLSRAKPPPRVSDALNDPSTDAVPGALVNMLGAEKPMSLETWQKLEALERWVLEKVSHSKNSERLPRAYDEIVGKRTRLTHLNANSEAHMVETASKPLTTRRAVAITTVTMSETAHRALLEGNAPKGDVLGTARIAGIMAAKQTSQLIPLCHPIHITQVELSITPSPSDHSVALRAEVVAIDRTGVEMEAMVAVSIAALTIYDMLKAIDRGMIVGPTRLIEKSGGKSGDFRA